MCEGHTVDRERERERESDRERELRSALGEDATLPLLCPLLMGISLIIIHYHVIGHKFNKLLRAPENQYLLNAVYV